MEQWNSDSDDYYLEISDELESNGDDYLEVLHKLERDVILMNYGLTDLEIPSEFGEFEKNFPKTKKEDKVVASLETWTKYRYLLYLYKGVPEDEKRELNLGKFNGKNFNELRKKLVDKTLSTNEFSQFNRNIKNQLNLIIYYILEGYKENFKKEKMYYVISGTENDRENSMSNYDLHFWGYLYENRERAKALMQKKVSVTDITEDDEKLLSYIHINFARIAKRKQSHIDETSFEEMWKNVFYEFDLERKENEIISYLEKLKKLILEKTKDERYQDFLDMALKEIKISYNLIAKK